MSTRTRTLSAKQMEAMEKGVTTLVNAYDDAYEYWLGQITELGAPRDQVHEKKAVRKLVATGIKRILDAHENSKTQLDRTIYFLPASERLIKEPEVEILGNTLTKSYMRLFSLYCDYLESERISYSDLRSRFG